MKKQSSNATRKQAGQTTKPSRNRTIIIIVIILAVLGGLLWLMRPESSSRDKDALRQEAANLLDRINLHGTVVYSQIQDEGCDDKSSVGFAYYVTCGYSGGKVYQNGEDLVTDLKAADSALRGLGFQPALFSSQKQRDFDNVLNGVKQSDTLRYKNGSQAISVDLSYLRDNGKSNDSGIKSLVQGGKVNAPTEGKYLYGISISAGYFSCSHDSILQLPCPPLPGPLKR